MVFENPMTIYIIDYNGAERYAKDIFHKRFNMNPNGSLSSTTDLLTLPTDKRILVYGPTGQETAYVVAYLMSWVTTPAILPMEPTVLCTKL